MGLFHKTLKQAESKLNQNNFKGAETILLKHMLDEHGIDSISTKFLIEWHHFESRLNDIIGKIQTHVEAKSRFRRGANPLNHEMGELEESLKRSESHLKLLLKKIKLEK